MGCIGGPVHGGWPWPPFSKLPGSNKAFGIRHKCFGRETDLNLLAGRTRPMGGGLGRKKLIEALKDYSVSAGERGAASEVRLKQFDPSWGTGRGGHNREYKQASPLN